MDITRAPGGTARGPVPVMTVDAGIPALDAGWGLMQLAQRCVERDPRLDLVAPAGPAGLTFRCRAMPGESTADNDLRNADAVARTSASGALFLTATHLDGRYAIRLSIMDASIREEDVVFALDRIAAEGRRLGLEATARLAVRAAWRRELPIA